MLHTSLSTGLSGIQFAKKLEWAHVGLSLKNGKKKKKRRYLRMHSATILNDALRV